MASAASEPRTSSGTKQKAAWAKARGLACVRRAMTEAARAPAGPATATVVAASSTTSPTTSAADVKPRRRGVGRVALSHRLDLGHLAGTRHGVEHGAEGALQIEGARIGLGVAREDLVRHLTTACTLMSCPPISSKSTRERWMRAAAAAPLALKRASCCLDALVHLGERLGRGVGRVRGVDNREAAGKRAVRPEHDADALGVPRCAPGTRS